MSAEETALESQANMHLFDFDSLLLVLKSTDNEKRIAAMQALGRLGDPRTIEILRALLRDSDLTIRRTAARVLYSMLAESAEMVLDKNTLQHILRFRAPEEILSSATAVRLFLKTLDCLDTNSSTLDIEHGEGTVVSGSPMDDYRPLIIRDSGTESDTNDTVRRVLTFFEGIKGDASGWWTVGPARGAGVIAFRQGDRYGEILHELAIVRIAPDRYLSLATRCRYADWD
jgi:hypothetical protein